MEADVTFFLPGSDLDRVSALDPDRDWREFGFGVHAWILQTFLRLRAAGWAVRLSRELPDAGRARSARAPKILVAHADSAVHELSVDPELTLVVVRADKMSQSYADFEIVQNESGADGRRVFHVPHWTQPGLVPRDASRGNSVEVIEFKGHVVSLNVGLRATGFGEALRRRGYEWVVDEVDYRGHSAQAYAGCAWNDYSRTDVALAVRPKWRDSYSSKPATKLLNSWMAGAPAILGADKAFRDLRRSELDYLEVGSVEDVLAAVESLRRDPAKYRAMIENGLARARNFTPAKTVSRWTELLFETIPRESRRSRGRLARQADYARFALRRRLRASGTITVVKRAAEIVRGR
ncbi:MAG: glycosyltransferase family 1 protein [Deltaproteobacteria bacterium]|nr:glycosyltransferase family 1 protein [Deltaproteobacteria bacterium]